MLAYRSRHRAVFLFGFAKSERDNIASDELAGLREIGAAWLAGTDAALAEAVDDGRPMEVEHGNEA